MVVSELPPNCASLSQLDFTFPELALAHSEPAVYQTIALGFRTRASSMLSQVGKPLSQNVVRPVAFKTCSLFYADP